jgi:uncharacterized protein YheU (UPF0270 family)
LAGLAFFARDIFLLVERTKGVYCLSERRDPIAIPHTELSPEALAGVVESFVLREGTDYGDREYSLAEKVTHVMRQLERGEARIIFDPNTETVDIVAI